MLLNIVTNSTNKNPQFHAFIPTGVNFTLQVDQKIWQRSSWLLRGLLLVDGSEEGDHEVDGAAADDEGGEADDERRVIRVADRHRHFNGVDILENGEITSNSVTGSEFPITSSQQLMFLCNNVKGTFGNN